MSRPRQKCHSIVWSPAQKHQTNHEPTRMTALNTPPVGLPLRHPTVHPPTPVPTPSKSLTTLSSRRRPQPSRVLPVIHHSLPLRPLHCGANAPLHQHLIADSPVCDVWSVAVLPRTARPPLAPGPRAAAVPIPAHARRPPGTLAGRSQRQVRRLVIGCAIVCVPGGVLDLDLEDRARLDGVAVRSSSG